MALDKRSFRNEQIAAAIEAPDPLELARFNTERFDPTRTMPGGAQLQRLVDDLLAAEEAASPGSSSTRPNRSGSREPGLGTADSVEG